MKRIMTLIISLSAFAVFGETRQDKAGLTPLYWIDLNGTESQWGKETLHGDNNFDGFRPIVYEPISYWGRKGCYSFNDARGQQFACGTGSFTMFIVARGGNAYSGDDAIVFCLGKKYSKNTHESPALELVIRNPITDPSNINSNLVAVRTWDTTNAAPRDVIRTAVPGCYAAYRYVPYAIVYDSPSTTLKLYANGVEIASKTGDFTGFTASTCWWQVASVRGGNEEGKTGMRDRCGVTDFRYYASALTAAEVATISSDFPLADQTGEMPYYHYAFDGSYRFYNPGSANDIASNVCQCLGADRVCNDYNLTGTRTYYSNARKNYFAEYSCETLRGGICAARSISGSNGYGDYWPLTNSFTFAISAKMNPAANVQNAVLAAFGSANGNGGKASHGGLALVLRDKGKVGLYYWGANRKPQLGLTASLGCTDYEHFHDYAVVHDREAGTMSLYVDGSFHGFFAHSGFTNSDEDGVHGCWQFGGVHGGTVSPLSASSAHTVEEFRFYTKALTATQVAALADAVPAWREGTDPSGRLPHYHYTFDGSVVPDGHRLLDVNGDAKQDSAIAVNGYRPIRGGARSAANVSTGNYGGHFPVDRPFTLFMSADPGYFTENACLFGIGTMNDGGVALMRRDLTTMAVGNWSSTVYPQTATVSDGVGGAFHAYAVNVDPVANKVQLFVDGVAVGEPVALPHDLTTGNWQFASIYGGMPSGGGIATNPDMLLEDFRVYVPALAASEIASLSAAYPAWSKKDGEGNRPDYWYKFEPSRSVPQGAKVLRDGASTIRKPVGGDSPVRDGVFACTNIAAVSGTSYGNAGGLQLGSSFSIFLSARAKRPTGVPGVLFALGRASSSETLAIAAESDDKVSCYSFSTSGKTLLVQSEVPGMQEDFNAYCVTWNGTTEMLTLYLNGTAVASRETGADFFGFSSNPPWQLANVYGNIDSGIMKSGVMTLEDFRVYSRALTAAEVASISAELPRWPRGALWQGGNSGSLTDAVWQKWDWSAAAYGDWVYNTTLAAGDSAAIGASETPLALVGTGSPRLGELYVARPVALSGTAISCSSLEVASGASLKPAGVVSLLSPGTKLAVVADGVVSGIDLTVADEYGNKYYLGAGNKLYYGDGSFPGMLLLFK